MEARTADPAASLWLDTPERYGLVSRVLHRGMAALLFWQFGMLLAFRILGPLDILKTIASFGPYHGTVGLLTFWLVLVRVAWAAVNRRRRPPHAPGLAGLMARAGHAALYLAMFAVPGVALLRTYGRGDGWSPWGIPFIPATGRRVAWMTDLANAGHGLLAWTLAVLIAGHVAIAVLHGLWLRDGVFSRMAGRLRAPARPRRNHQLTSERKKAPYVA